MIAFVGSVFSPTYFGARARRLTVAPEAHCALNVALYGPGGRWAFTEHPSSRVARAAQSFALGDSVLHWEGDALVVDLNERTPIVGRPLRGRVRLHPHVLLADPESLDTDARHQWCCLAPMATVEVELSEPRWAFRGAAYLDANGGREPLEQGMQRWDWCRARAGDDAVVLYDTWPRRGEPVERAFRFDPRGGREPIEGLVRHGLSCTRWGLQRSTRADPGCAPSMRQPLEDTPFYSRSLLDTRVGGAPLVAVHESVSLDRFRHPLVQRMLPFRIRPRWRA